MTAELNDLRIESEFLGLGALKLRFGYWKEAFLERHGTDGKFAGEKMGIEQALHPSYLKDLDWSPEIARELVGYFSEVASEAFQAWCEDSLFETNPKVLEIIEAAKEKSEEVQTPALSVIE